MKLVNPNEKVLAQLRGYKTVKIAGEAVNRDEKIILTDERMYFLVDELGKVCKYIDNKKVDKIFFDSKINGLMLECEDIWYPFEIIADEADLRALCKAFKQMKKDRKIPIKRDLFYYSPIMTILSEEPGNVDMSIFEEKEDYNPATELAKAVDGINDVLESGSSEEQNMTKEEMEGTLKIDTTESKGGLFEDVKEEKPKKQNRLFFKR